MKAAHRKSAIRGLTLMANLLRKKGWVQGESVAYADGSFEGKEDKIIGFCITGAHQHVHASKHALKALATYVYKNVGSYFGDPDYDSRDLCMGFNDWPSTTKKKVLRAITTTIKQLEKDTL